MAPQRQQRQWSKRAIAPTLLHRPILLVLLLSPLKMAGGASSGSYFSSCLEETLACEEDANCNACLTAWPVEDTLSACEDYPIEATATDASCLESGAEYCCGFATETAESCMEDPLLEAFWTCTLEHMGCALVDMPCSTAGVAAIVDEAEPGGDDSAASPVGHASSSSLLLSAAAAGLVAAVVTGASTFFSLA